MFRPTMVMAASLAVGLLMGLPGASAAERVKKSPQKPDPSVAAVEKVLRAEVAGPVDRRELLATAIREQPGARATRWQAGFILDGNSWQSFDTATSPSASPGIIEEYESRRRGATRTVEGQTELADWCKKHGLLDQERAHLWAALDIASDAEKPGLFDRLGFVAVGNQWLSRADLEQWRACNQRTFDSIKRWGRKFEQISRQLEGTPREQTIARTTLAQIADPAAIPAMEYLLCGSESAAGPAVSAFSRMPEYESTIALARQAAFSKWPQVRTQAAQALKSRRFDDFVPGLIGSMATQASTAHSNQLVYLWNRDGKSETGVFVLLRSYLVARETDDQFQVGVSRITGSATG